MSAAELYPRFRVPGENSSSRAVKQIGAIRIGVLLGMALLALVSFNHADFESANDKVGLNLQSMVKLGVLGLAGLYGLWGFISDERVQRIVLSLPVLWVVGICFFYFLAVPGSITPTESLASTVSIPCVVLLTVTALVQIGTQKIVDLIFYTLATFVMLSWLAFFLVPSVGVFNEPIANGEFTTRMSGLAHPNTLGQFSGLAIVIGAYLFRESRLNLVGKLIVVVSVLALVASLSRTSLVATVIGVACIYRDRVFQKEVLGALAFGGFLAAAALVYLSLSSDLPNVIEEKLTLISKSGDTAELTSGTGRAAIWAKTTQLIGVKPLTGYGATTSKYFLAEYSLYAHNMILNIAFTGGVFAGMFAVFMCFGRIVAFFQEPHRIADALAIFILVNGLAENVVFSILSGLPTIIWTMALCLRQSEAIREKPIETPKVTRLRTT